MNYLSVRAWSAFISLLLHAPPPKAAQGGTDTEGSSTGLKANRSLFVVGVKAALGFHPLKCTFKG